MSGFADFLINHHVPQAVGSTEMPECEDMYEGNVTSLCCNMSAWSGIVYIVSKTTSATGTATATVESCSAYAGTNNTAVTFMYRKATTPDTFTAWTTSASLAITAGSDEVWEIAIASSDLYKGTETAPVNHQYVRLVLTETESTAQDGSVVSILYGPKFGHEIPDTDMA